MKKENYSIVFIGAGNVATHLAVALHKAGYEIVQVYSRSLQSARDLAAKTQATFTNDLKALKLSLSRKTLLTISWLICVFQF